jgi:PAS domain S-box-containing protein
MSENHEQYQLELFSTIIKWMNVVVIAAVVLNSYFLLTDFWITLAQNAASLSMVALGLVCLRLAKGGQPQLATRLYVSVTLLLSALLIVIVSPAFILNGALALAIFLLVSTYLDSPKAALYWGAAGIIVYVVALTVRVFGPFEGLGLGPAQLATMYALPPIGLLGFALLGRHATGQLHQALVQSEWARQDLVRSNQELLEAQADLAIANEQLSLELARRKQAEEDLRNSLQETLHGRELLLALNRAGQAVQKARSAEQVYETISAEIKNLDRQAIILKLSADGTQLQVIYSSYQPEVRDELQDLIGFNTMGYSFPIPPDGLFHKAVKPDAPAQAISIAGYITEALPNLPKRLINQVASAMGSTEMILTPLAADDKVQGILAVSGSGMGQAEAQAVAAFANQTAIALTNVRLLQETQAWAKELEQRVEQRTAELTASEARYRRLFDSNRDSLFVVDSQGQILDANPAACHLLGYEHGELVGSKVTRFRAESTDMAPSEQREALERMHRTWSQGVTRYETAVLRSDGAEVPVEIRATPLTYQDQAAVLGAARDITDRKRVESELRRLGEEQRDSRLRMQRLARQVVSAQEDERLRISRVLHDEAGQSLTALRISLELAEQEAPPEYAALAKRILDAQVLTDQILEGMRQMAQDLRPPALDTIGLSHTLEAYCKDFAGRTGLSISYDYKDPVVVPEPANVTLYRFVQEALTNVARHARASQVWVELQSDASSVRLSVKDNGQGFDPSAFILSSAGSKGMGLESMRERLKALGGWLEIESVPGTSSRLIAHVPLQQVHADAH